MAKEQSHPEGKAYAVENSAQDVPGQPAVESVPKRDTLQDLLSGKPVVHRAADQGSSVTNTPAGPIAPRLDFSTASLEAPLISGGRFPDAPSIDQVIGDCQIVEQLGQGGMGVVFKAVRRMLKRIVALKVLPPSIRDAVPVLAKRFVIEAQSAASLSHPNIVTVFNAGVDGDFAFIEMEYVQGQPVSNLFMNGPLTESETLRIGIAAADALGYAHAMGLVHRDVKPSNLLLRRDGVVKLSDFGLAGVAVATSRSAAPETLPKAASMIAAPLSSRLTEFGTVMGTPGFMSPEQGNALPVDHRTDIFALGATLYCMLCGMPPRGEHPPATMMELQARGQVPSICSLNRRVTKRTAAAVAKAMAPDPDDRFASCAEFAAALTPPPNEGAASGTPADRAFWNGFAQVMRGIRRPNA